MTKKKEKTMEEKQKLSAEDRKAFYESVIRSMPKQKGDEVMTCDVSVLPKVNFENRRGLNNRGGVRKLNMSEWAELISLYNSGWAVSAIAERFKVTRNTVYNYLKTAAKLQQA